MSPGVRCPRRTRTHAARYYPMSGSRDGGRIVVPSTPIHDPITKRVSRYNRSRDPYLTLPCPEWSWTPSFRKTSLLRGLGRYLVDKRVVDATFHPDIVASRKVEPRRIINVDELEQVAQVNGSRKNRFDNVSTRN